MLPQRQVFRGDSSAVAEQRAQEENDRADDAHCSTSIRFT
jgi:hypothetical protein